MQKARRHGNMPLRLFVGTRFQVLFTPLFGVLFTFPSRYWSTIGLPGVFSLGGWCRRVHAGFLRSRATQDTAMSVVFARTGLSPDTAQFPTCFRFFLRYNVAVLQPHSCRNINGLGFSAFARHYLRNHSCFLLLRLLRCFSSARSPTTLSGMTCLQHAGLPHSETRGSSRMCRSPRLIAACRVLLRLWEPRHPPCALIYFLPSAAPFA